MTGLDNVDAASIEYLIIQGNELLSTCDVKSICDYLASPNGFNDIHDNASGCNSPEEVEEACDTVSVMELIYEDKFTISPNPLKSRAIIEYSINNNSQVTLKILDLSGKVVAILIDEFQRNGKHNVMFDGTKLNSGIYFCSLNTIQSRQIEKIVLMR